MLLNETKIYVGTYRKYNEGSLYGKWVTLGDFEDLNEFYDFCKKLHEDEEDPEFMFQDYEVPELLEGMVWESGIDKDIFEKAEELQVLEDLEDNDWLSIHNEYDNGTYLYYFDDYFFDEWFHKPSDAARAVHFGDINWNDEYIFFNGYGNLETTDDIWTVLDKKELTEFYLENKHLFNF